MIPLARRARRACPYKVGKHARCPWCLTIEAEMRGLIREADAFVTRQWGSGVGGTLLEVYGLAPKRRRKA